MVKFYHRSLPMAATYQAPLNSYLHDSRENGMREINWTPEATEAFEKVKANFAKPSLQRLFIRV